MKNCRTLILFSFLLMGFIMSTVSAQQMQSLDQSLSLLRGMWETHTFRDKFRITFLDDKKMVYDRQDAGYAVSPELIKIHTEKGNLTYSYAFQNDKLVLIDAYGKELDLNRERFGLLERQCLGDYFSGYDTSGCEELLSFNDDGTFSYSKQCKIMDSESTDDNTDVKIVDIGRHDGVYRVENTFIVLTFDNGLVREAIVRFRDNDNNVIGIVFNGRIFDKELGDDLFSYKPVDGYPGPEPPPPPPPPPPPCYDCGLPPCVDCYPPPPPPPPGHYCPPPSSGGVTSTPPAAEPVRDHRDTGSTRGNPEPSHTDTGSRQGGRRPF